MFRSASVVLSSALMALLAACSEAPTASTAAEDASDRSPVVAAQAAPSSSCIIGTSPEFTATVSWSRLPVQRIVLWHSLLDRSVTQTLNHQAQKGAITVLLGFEPVLAVLYDRDGLEVSRRSCNTI